MKISALYLKLCEVIDIPVIETGRIWTKGLFINENGIEPKIYIKKDLEPLEKLQVLLHEYTHYLHLTKFYEDESRAESEIIAESSVIFVLRVFGVASLEKPILTEFIHDPSRIGHLSAKIQQVCNEIISNLK